MIVDGQTQRVALSPANEAYGLGAIDELDELRGRRHSGWRVVAGLLATGGAALGVLGLWGVGSGLVSWGLALALLMAPAYLALAIFAPQAPALRPIESQQRHWLAVRTRLLFYHRVRQAAVASAWAGIGMVALARLWAGQPVGTTLLGTGAFTLLVAAMLWGAVTVRRGDTLEMARQTALLQRLESQGLAPAGTLDPRVRRVLRALDEVLADVPDSTLARFLESEESSLYLELLAEARNE